MTKKKHCCSMMEKNTNNSCDVHEFRKDCPDMLVDYHDSSKEYVLMIHDGGSSGIVINYCPWCGTALYSA